MPEEKNLPEVIRRHLDAGHGDRLVLLCDRGEMTYEEWWLAGHQFARSLNALGFDSGDRLGLLCSNRAEWLVAALGAMLAGGEVAPLNTWVKRSELSQFLDHTKPRILVSIDRLGHQDFQQMIRDLLPEIETETEAELASEAYPYLRRVVLIDSPDAPRGALSFSEMCQPAATVDSDDLASMCPEIALVLYTSGTTSRPKAVPLYHSLAVENARYAAQRLEMVRDDLVWVPLPMSWAYGSVNALFSIVHAGATMLVRERFNAVDDIDMVMSLRPGIAYLLPGIVDSLLEAPNLPAGGLSSVDRGTTIGAARDIRRARMDLGVSRIVQIYGGTETYGTCCCSALTDSGELRDTSQGLPLTGMNIRAWDVDKDKECPPGIVGEIQISGRVAHGYLTPEGVLERPESTFTSDGYLRMGDLGTVDEEGRLRFYARGSEVARVRDINVSPVEVEAFLMQQRGVRDVGVVGVADSRRPGADRLVAAVVADADDGVDLMDLRRQCEEELARYKVPSHFYVVDDIPRSEVGKIKRRELESRAAAYLTSQGAE